MASAGTARPATITVAHPEEENTRGDGEGVATGALPPAKLDDTQKETAPHSDHPTSKESGATVVEERNLDIETPAKETPAPSSPNEHSDTTSSIKRPAPAHLDQSAWALSLESDLRAIKS